MVPENVVPVHHECHMRHGQTEEMKRRSLAAAVRALGFERIASWYESLDLPGGRAYLESLLEE